MAQQRIEAMPVDGATVAKEAGARDTRGSGRRAARGLTDIAQLCYRSAEREDPMVRKVTLRQMGGSVGATLPKDIAERMHVAPGDEIFIIETENGVLLTPYDPTFEKAMEAYRRGAKKYRNALRELAK
jgi:putative addiction module antidote